MALNSGKILMRRGQEVNFDPEKMTPGEWAVSLDNKYVRMCFSPGVCVRMATYDAFEADMQQIERILSECQTIEEVVTRINEEIKDVVVDVERVEIAASSALQSEENALNSANSAMQSAETAMNKAEEALNSANIATEKAAESTLGAETATQKAEEALQSSENVRNMSDVSQSYAVGGTGTRDGEDTDNSKYYNQQASDNADRAEAAAERASSVADVGVATTEKAGLVKPDGDTIRVDPDGTIHADRGTTSYTDLENKPKINDVVLEGEKTLDELGIASKEALEETDSKVNIIIEQAELRFKETASGENIHLDDSADAKLVEFGMYGKAKQNTTIGKNLIHYPYHNTTHTENGEIAWTDNGDGSVTVNGKNTGTTTAQFYFVDDKDLGLKPDTTYILTGCPSGGSYSNYRMRAICNYQLDEEKHYYDFGEGVTFTTPSNYTHLRILVDISVGATIDNLTFKPMLRLASITDDTWEPYTGGIPSPNPEYPQDIEVAGNSGSVEVKSCGKNLYDISKTTPFASTSLMDVKNNSIRVYNTSPSTYIGTKYLLDGTEIKIGKTYTFSADVKYTSGSGRLVLRGKSGNIKLGTAIIKSSGAYRFKFEMQEEGDYLSLLCTGSTAELGDITYSNIQLEEGEVIPEYEPYKETLSTIPTPNGLAGIPIDSGGNYTDSNGQQWICDEVVKYADGSGEKIQRVGIIDSYSAETITGVYMSTTGELTEGAKILYQLAKPITTSLTAEELAEIEKLSTFYSVTNMSNDFDCGMKVKYIADAKSYIDNRLALIEQAMLNSI